MTELWRLSALDLAHGIRTRRFAAREAVGAVIERMRAVNPAINAVVDDLAEAALAAADAADQAVARGAALGPLHGVPVTVKVNVDYAGRANTNGVEAQRDLVAAEDSPPVANWRKAGAIVVGRTNTPAYSWRWFTSNAIHGKTYNPVNRALTPGGSSGGASAALAAGIGPLAHGNDYGGSIRYPAYCCGLSGIRPSFGRVPAFNGTAPAERPPTAQLFSTQGPLARTIGDLRVGLATMAAHDPRDPWWTAAPLEGPPPERPIRVALTIDPCGSGTDPVVATALRRAADWLAEAGYAVEEVAVPTLAEAADLWQGLVMTEAELFMKPLIEANADPESRRAILAMIGLGSPLSLGDYSSGLGRRTGLVRQIHAFLARYPLILMPVSGAPPFPADHDQEPEAIARIVAAQRPMLATALLGLPGLAVATGIADGVPAGVQLVAARFREDLCLAAGEVVEARAGIDPVVEPFAP